MQGQVAWLLLTAPIPGQSGSPGPPVGFYWAYTSLFLLVDQEDSRCMNAKSLEEGRARKTTCGLRAIGHLLALILPTLCKNKLTNAWWCDCSPPPTPNTQIRLVYRDALVSLDIFLWNL